MATLRFTGFELGDGVEGSTAIAGTASIQSSVTRGAWSAYALRCNPTTTAVGSLTVFGFVATGTGAQAVHNAATAYYRFYFRYGTKPSANDEPIFTVRRQVGNASKLELRISSAGVLVAYDSATTPVLMATGTTALAAGTWYRIELMAATGTTAAWEVKIDGVSEMSGTGDLSTSNNGGVIFGKFADRNGNSVDFFYDDYLASNSAYPGAGKSSLLAPDANGTYQAFSIGAGSGSHYQIVNELPQNGDTSYLLSTLTANDAETEDMAASPSGIGVINCACPMAVVKRDGASNGAIRLRLRSGSTDSTTGSNYASTSAYAAIGRLYDTDPATSAAWTTSGLDGCQVGIVEQSAANRTRLTGAYLLYDWADPVPPVNSVAPAVTPSPASVGQSCSCTTGTWTGNPTSYSYQWKLNGSNVGTDSSSYTPLATGTLTCTVTASNAAGAGSPAVSNSVTVSPGGGFSLINSGLCRSPLLGGLVR